LQVITLAALGASFIVLQLLSIAPYVILYFLPYGFMVTKSFTQMPGHIQLVVGISNTIIFSTPIIISLTMYIILTNAVKKRDHAAADEEDQAPDISSNSSNLKITPWRKNTVAPNKPQDVAIPTLNTINETSSQSSGIHIIETVTIQTKSNIKNIQSSTHPDTCPDDPEEVGRYPHRPSMEIEAALRSMKTNLLMLLLFFLNFFLLLIPYDTWRVFWDLIVQSLLKFVLPTFTTISNFGPVREVVAIYLQRMFHRRVPSA
jgi:hypothetical protein